MHLTAVSPHCALSSLPRVCSDEGVGLLELLEHLFIGEGPACSILRVVVDGIHNDLGLRTMWVLVNVRLLAMALVEHIPRVDTHSLSVLLSSLALIQHRSRSVEEVPHVASLSSYSLGASLSRLHDAVDAS